MDATFTEYNDYSLTKTCEFETNYYEVAIFATDCQINGEFVYATVSKRKGSEILDTKFGHYRQTLEFIKEFGGILKIKLDSNKMLSSDQIMGA